jgi:hypothetical protein
VNTNQTKEAKEMPKYFCTVQLDLRGEIEVEIEAADEDAAIEAAEIAVRDGWTMSDIHEVEVKVDRRPQLVDEAASDDAGLLR